MKWNELDLNTRHEYLTWHTPIWEPMIDWGLNTFGDLSGKRVLEIGCGDGGFACLLALCGAEVFATEIAAHRLEKAKALFDKTVPGGKGHFLLADGYDLPFRSDGFDLIITRLVLILLDRSIVLPRWRNLLVAQTGQAVFFENMNNHPFLTLWRRITGTKWGRYGYLSVREIDQFDLYFGTVDTHYVGLTVPAAGLIRKLERYLVRPFTAFDRLLLSTFPRLKTACWLVAVRCKP